VKARSSADPIPFLSLHLVLDIAPSSQPHLATIVRSMYLNLGCPECPDRIGPICWVLLGLLMSPGSGYSVRVTRCRCSNACGQVTGNGLRFSQHTTSCRETSPVCWVALISLRQTLKSMGLRWTEQISRLQYHAGVPRFGRGRRPDTAF
jgi:hypothetical protein